LVKHTHPSHPDYPALSDARTKMQELAVFINIQKKEAENIYEVIAIQDKLIGKFEVRTPPPPGTRTRLHRMCDGGLTRLLFPFLSSFLCLPYRACVLRVPEHRGSGAHVRVRGGHGRDPAGPEFQGQDPEDVQHDAQEEPRLPTNRT
jgi:hypothetical protein